MKNKLAVLYQESPSSQKKIYRSRLLEGKGRERPAIVTGAKQPRPAFSNVLFNISSIEIEKTTFLFLFLPSHRNPVHQTCQRSGLAKKEKKRRRVKDNPS